MKMPSLFSAIFLLLSLNVFAERAQQADRFVDSVGINTHLTYTDTSYYSHWSEVFSALQAMHVRHIRDGFYDWPVGDPLYSRHQQLHSAGIDCDYVVGTIPSADQIAEVKQYAGDMFSVEAQNELDDQKGSHWASVLHADLPALYAAGSAAKVPVLGPSLTYKASYVSLGDMAADMNYNNLHIYFGGRNPGSTGWGNRDAEGNYYGSILWWLDNAQVDAPGVPSIVTETGYLAKPNVRPYTLPQNIEAKYAPRTILEMFSAGVVRSYFYELVDEVTSPGYGMMTAGVTPKLAYTAVASLLDLLEDPGPSFQPDVLDYTITGASAQVHHLLLQKRHGHFYLALWVEASGYDEAANQVTPVPAQKVELNLQGAVAQETYSLDDHGILSSSTVRNQSQLALTLGDTVTVVQIFNH